MRPLDAAFKSLPGQAQEARLSFVQPASLESDYGLEALDRFKQLAEVSTSWLSYPRYPDSHLIPRGLSRDVN